MSEVIYDGTVSFEIDVFPGCCGIVVVCNGSDPDEEDDWSERLDTFREFINYVTDGEGVILFTDNPGGHLDKLYDMLDPSGTRWEKQTFLEFKNPNSGNQVVIKALVKT